MFFDVSDTTLAKFRAQRLVEFLREMGVDAELKTDVDIFGSRLSKDNGEIWPMVQLNVNGLYLGYFRGVHEVVKAFVIEWSEEEGFNSVDSIEIPDLDEDLNEEYVMLHRIDVTTN